jgi:hypothetical protein
MSNAPAELPATLVDVVARRVRDDILSGALEPGAKIVEEQLCAELGISRAPLREALRRLSELGLIEHLPRRGSRVVEWSPDDMRVATRTAPSYRLYALAGGPPERPGLVRVDAKGCCIAVEVHRLPMAEVGRLLAAVPAPLAIGTVELESEDAVHGFLCESAGLSGARDISEFGGWRAYSEFGGR